jgi:ubiquinone/menaquinone biosynthesis C-methylase UbiE
MEQQLELVREQQRESWNKFSPGWKKWDRLFMDFLEPMGNEIIQLLSPVANDIVLDVASGTGEPGLTIASSLHVRKVFITDLSENMLAIAGDNARMRGIMNIETLACDAGDLPFASDTFDAISCRLGFMFFPDMSLAAYEMARVLKSGGRLVTSVWNAPEKNFWITAMTSAIHSTIELPPPPPGAPGMFRCAKDGLMMELLSTAGFKNITVREVTGKLKCKTADVYWNVMTELAAPVVAALSQVNIPTRLSIRQRVMRLINERYPEGQVEIEGSALVICAEK